MSEREKLPYESAIEETARTAGKGIDLIKSASPAIANAYGWIIGDRIAAARDRNLDALNRKTKKIIEERDQAERIPVPEELGVSLLEAAEKETRDSLQDLYAALLANATDSRYADDVRLGFVETVKRLHPLDVLVFEACLKVSNRPGHTVFGVGHIQELLPDMRNSAMQVSLDTLRELGLLGNHPQGTTISSFGLEFQIACDPHVGEEAQQAD